MNTPYILIDSILERDLFKEEAKLKQAITDSKIAEAKVIELRNLRDSISKQVIQESESITNKLLSTLERIDKEELTDYKMPEDYTKRFDEPNYYRNKYSTEN